MEPVTKRNILLIVVDQWRGDTLPAVGHPVIRTPNIDRLSARGVTFARHYSQAAPCAPGRSSMLTGLYMMNHRVVRNGIPLDARHTNLALELRKAGYDPALTGYTTGTPDPRVVPPTDPRFQVTGTVVDGFTAIAPFFPEKRPYFSHLRTTGFDVPASDPMDVWLPAPDYPGADARGPTFAPTRFPAALSDSAYFTDRAVDWLKGHADRSWCLHLGYWRPHPPFIAPEPYHAMYDPADVPPPVRAADPEEEGAQHPLLRHYMANQQRKKFFQHGQGVVSTLDEREFRQIRATYYGMMTEVDAQIGRVLDLLEATGQIDNTLIVFTSDHGEQMGDHHMLGKQGYFDQSFHIPMIVCDPDPLADGTRGTVATRFTETVDLLPTVLDWAGREVPRNCDGRSLLPFCRGAAPEDWRTYVHYEFDFREVRNPQIERSLGLSLDECGLAVIQDEKYKYVHFTGLPALFFDLQDDPGQFVDRSRDPALRSTMLDYAQAMLSWRLGHAERTLTHMEAGPGGIYVRE